MPPPPPAVTKLSLSDVQNAFPQEAREETTVMDHIERTDPTTKSSTTGGGGGGRLYVAPSSGLTASTSGTSASSLLLDQATGIPAEFIQSMQAEKLEEMKAQEERIRMERTRSRLVSLGSIPEIEQQDSNTTTRTAGRHKKTATLSTEDELAELTNYLRPRQSIEGIEEGDEEEQERKPLTSAQKFAANATGMINNMKASIRPTLAVVVVTLMIVAVVNLLDRMGVAAK